MLSVREYRDVDSGAWDRFVLACEGSHPAQLSAWLAFTARTYAVARHAWLAEEDGEVRGILPLFAKRRLAQSSVLFSPPGGLVAADDDAAAALLGVAADLLAREQAEYVELRDQRSRWGDLVTSTEHYTHLLTLAADVESQWRGFDAKLRNQIRKAQRAGLSVHWGAEHVGEFHAVMLENMRDLGTPIRSESWFRQLLAVLGERATLLVVRRAGEPIGAMLLVVHGDCGVDVLASSLRRHFEHCPNQMLYWEALSEGIRRGLRTFDFGRSQQDTGTYRFKEQWGAQAVELFYQYLLRAGAAVPNFADQQHRMAAASAIWKRLPLSVARILGEPARRRFPEQV